VRLRDPAGGRVPVEPVPGLIRALAVITMLARRIRRGRPLRLALRLIAAAAAGALAVAGVGWQPASLAVGTGALTWLALTIGSELGSGRRD
jgi:hypothetical protein